MKCCRSFWVFSSDCCFSPSLADRQARSLDVAILTGAMSLYALNRFVWKHRASDALWGRILCFHFNDYLGAIVFLTYVNLLIAHVSPSARRVAGFRPTLLCALLCSVFWEGLFPLLAAYSTADIWDCVAYVLGGATYHVITRFAEKARESK